MREVYYDVRENAAQSRGGFLGLRGLWMLCEGLSDAGYPDCLGGCSAGELGTVCGLREMRKRVPGQCH